MRSSSVSGAVVSCAVLVFLISILPQNVAAQSVADCLRRVPELTPETFCDIRQYRITRGDAAARYLGCALTVVGFFGEDGSIQRNAVLSALDEVETHDGVYTDSVDACLSKTRKLTEAERPSSFFFCMLATESAQNFKDALELQELKAASKWAEGDSFDRAKVQQSLREVNRQLKCK